MLLSNWEGGRHLARVRGSLSSSPRVVLCQPQGGESRRLVCGAFFAAHQAPFSTRLCPPHKASGESSPGSQRRESDNDRSPCWASGVLPGLPLLPPPLPPCSHVSQLEARTSPPLPRAPPDQTLPLGFFPSKKETELLAGVQTEVAGTSWSPGAAAGWRYRHGDTSKNNSPASQVLFGL